MCLMSVFSYLVLAFVWLANNFFAKFLCCRFLWLRFSGIWQFEDAIRKQREHIGNWMKYSAWEESQKEFERARSVYERALEVDYRNQVSLTRLLKVATTTWSVSVVLQNHTDASTFRSHVQPLYTPGMRLHLLDVVTRSMSSMTLCETVLTCMSTVRTRFVTPHPPANACTSPSLAHQHVTASCHLPQAIARTLCRAAHLIRPDSMCRYRPHFLRFVLTRQSGCATPSLR